MPGPNKADLLNSRSVALWNNTGENYPRPRPAVNPVLCQAQRANYNSFNMNKLEGLDFFLSPFTWHINCFSLCFRKAEMAKLAKRILLIDPDGRVRKELASFLKSEDYEVEMGRSFSEAIKKISQGNYGCLILDVDLPEMRGYEAVSILKNLDPKLKIIMTAGKNTKRLEAKVREQDIFFYFIKSFGKDELKLAVRNALSQ